MKTHVINSKRILNYAFLILGSLFLLLMISCSKEDDSPTPPPEDSELAESDGVTAEDFEIYEGALGLVYNARNIAKKGYAPTTADLVIIDSQGNDYSQTIDLDPYSFMGRVEIPVEDLSEEAKNELINGLPVGVVVKGDDGSTIFSNSISALSFQNNPEPTTINVSTLTETDENLTLNFNDAEYLFQRVEDDGDLTDNALRNNSSQTGYTKLGTPDFQDPHSNYNMKLIPVGSDDSDVFLIQHIASDDLLTAAGGFLAGFEVAIMPMWSDDTSIASAMSNDDFHFKINRLENGVYTIERDGLPVRKHSDTDKLAFELAFGSTSGLDVIYFRPIATDVNWQVETIATSFVAPILPKAQTSFGANSTLTNCTSGGGLSQTVGTTLEETYEDKIGWSESLSITTTNSIGVEATLSVGFGASFFGTGTDVNASVTASYDYSRSATESSSNFGERTVTNTETIFQSTEVTVPPNSASLVYQVIQFYPNTKVQIAQRLRIRATNGSGAAINGTNIASQFRFSRFDGVITEVGSDFVEVSLLGTLTLDKVLDTQSTVQEVEPNCN